MRFFQILVLCLLVFQVRAHAQNTAEFDMDAENISAGYAECAAYYRLIYFAMKQSNAEETANNYRQVEDRAMLYSLLMSQAGRSQDKAVEVTNSRIEMYMKEMKYEIDNRNENISILINNYNEPCINRMNNPPKKLLEAIVKYGKK